MVCITRIVSGEQHRLMSEAAMARGWYRNDKRMFLPGMAWYCPWFLEHDDMDILSEHYRRDWAGKREPITVVCPNGGTWCIDQKSSNGTGWTVTVGAEPHLITCNPSIVCGDYHGYLRNGEFTADLESRTYG